MIVRRRAEKLFPFGYNIFVFISKHINCSSKESLESHLHIIIPSVIFPPSQNHNLHRAANVRPVSAHHQQTILVTFHRTIGENAPQLLHHQRNDSLSDTSRSGWGTRSSRMGQDHDNMQSAQRRNQLHEGILSLTTRQCAGVHCRCCGIESLSR